jgi:hypothetical protein
MLALPQCEGEQWIVDVPDDLAHLVALVLVGQAFHAALILEGTQLGTPKITAKLKETLNKDLHHMLGCCPQGKDGRREDRQLASQGDQPRHRRSQGYRRPSRENPDESDGL